MKLTAKLAPVAIALMSTVGALTGCAQEEAPLAQTQDVSQSVSFEYRVRQNFDVRGYELTFAVNGRALLIHVDRPTTDGGLDAAMEAMNQALQTPERIAVIPTEDNWPVREDGEHQVVLVDGEDEDEPIAVGVPVSREEAELVREALLDEYHPSKADFDLWHIGPCGFGIFAFEDEYYAGRFDPRDGTVSYYSPAASSPAGAREWAAAAASAAAEPWNWKTEQTDDDRYRAVLRRGGQTLMYGNRRYDRRFEAEDATIFMVCL